MIYNCFYLKNIILMVNFLYQIDTGFKNLMSKKTITRKDLLELKSFIIEAYDNDGILDLEEMNNMQKTLILDLYNL
uniref:Uncharacterized protein n=1 Tax=viral metagenome TaxID=1070528 RepID=A0A6C0LGI8_9ZZZZ